MTPDFPFLFVLLVVVLAYLLGATDKEDQRRKVRDLQQENALLKARLSHLQQEEIL